MVSDRKQNNRKYFHLLNNEVNFQAEWSEEDYTITDRPISS